MALELATRNSGKHRIVTVKGELDMNNVKQLKIIFDVEVENGIRDVVVEMTDLSYIDSSGIGIFIAIMNKLRTVNGTVTLMAMKPEVERIFQLTKLTSFFKIIKSETELEGYVPPPQSQPGQKTPQQPTHSSQTPVQLPTESQQSPAQQQQTDPSLFQRPKQDTPNNDYQMSQSTSQDSHQRQQQTENDADKGEKNDDESTDASSFLRKN